MSDTKTKFLLENDVVPLTFAEIDNIESMYVPGDKTGSQITTADIDEMLEEGDLSDNEQGSSIPSDIPADYDGDVSNQEIEEVLQN